MIELPQVKLSKFAETIMKQKYSHDLDNGEKEEWHNIAYRVPKHVMKAVRAQKSVVERIQMLIAERKFIPGGRYLAATGRLFHQVNNCFLFRGEDSREGWADLMQKGTLALMTGGGIGVDYSEIREEGKLIRKTGGFATGPIAAACMLNECGRYIMQGGSRRSAIWAGLKWDHADIQKFITLKNWIPEVRAMKAKDYNFPATMDGTNISVLLNDEFFEAFNDEKHPRHSQAESVYWTAVRQMLKTGEPGFSIDCGKNSRETLRNAPLSGNTTIITPSGVQKIIDVLHTPISVWTGHQFAPDVVFSRTGTNVPTVKITMTGRRELVCDPTHPILVERYKGAGEKRKLLKIDRVAAKNLVAGDIIHTSYPSVNNLSEPSCEPYTLGFLYGDGSFGVSGNAEVTICDPSKEPCGTIVKQSIRKSSAYQDRRGYERIYMICDKFFKDRSKSIFPQDVFISPPEYRASFIAGLFDADGNYDETQNRVRLGSVNFEFLQDTRRVLDSLGIQTSINKGSKSGYGSDREQWMLVVCSDYVSTFSHVIPTVRLQVDEHESYRDSHIKVVSVEPDEPQDVYCADVRVAEHSFMAEGIIVSNCTEITSSDDCDVCNLGSINLARISSLDEMREVTELASAFLLAGTVYSDVPFAQVDKIRTKNRRLGLGLMGIHEWLLIHDKKYGPDDELEEYLKIYAQSGHLVKPYAAKWDLSNPVKTRAIAPVGTIGILGETTTGIESIFCSAYKRRYLKGSVWQFQYVVDPTAKRLLETGVPVDLIEDAYDLAADVERRIAFQAWVQQYVDHSISSTINLPKWGSELNNEDTVQKFGKILIKYLPKLRGITFYPDGARDGQPLNAVPLAEAIRHEGEIFEEAGNVCEISRGGECGA